MDKNEKIKICFEYIEDHSIITDKTERSVSGTAQSRASIKQNMKRNKSPIFNALIDALVLALTDKTDFIAKNGVMRREKNREIDNLQFRLSETEQKIKNLEKTIKNKDTEIEFLTKKYKWCENGINNMKIKVENQDKMIISLQEQINKLSNK